MNKQAYVAGYMAAYLNKEAGAYDIGALFDPSAWKSLLLGTGKLKTGGTVDQRNKALQQASTVPPTPQKKITAPAAPRNVAGTVSAPTKPSPTSPIQPPTAQGETTTA
jgi:hypothetical protein